MLFIKNNLTPLAILLSAILISVAIYYEYGFENVQRVFSIIGSFSIVIALAAYLYKKKLDQTVAAIDQISFFREKIIPEWANIATCLRNKNPNYLFSRIQIGTALHINDLKKDYSRNFKDQLSIFFIQEKVDSKSFKDAIDSNILDKQTLLLNLLEEFSLKVKHHATQNNAALNSVHAVFIELIEKNIVALFFMRDILVGNPIYSSILELYNSWFTTVHKSNALKNLVAFDFVSQQTADEVFERQRENVRLRDKN